MNKGRSLYQSDVDTKLFTVIFLENLRFIEISLLLSNNVAYFSDMMEAFNRFTWMETAEIIIEFVEECKL